MDDYTAEITQDIRNEVKVHGAAEVAERTGISEAAIREVAPGEARRWDEVVATGIEDERKRGSGLGLAPHQQR